MTWTLCRPIFAIVSIVVTSAVMTPVKGVHPGEAETHHPAGWRLSMPKGDPVKGREVFVKYECYFCHEVRGAKTLPE
jgi:cbb3-type cytochrome oxidase cytochrome c subunit